MTNPQPKYPLQIRNVGRMWRVIQGDRTLAFASTYVLASARHAELSRNQIIQPIQH